MTGTCNICGRGSVTINASHICARCWVNRAGRGHVQQPFNPGTFNPFEEDDDPFNEPVTPPPPPPPKVPAKREPTPEEKKLEKLKKYFAHAARREGNENEARAFSLRIFKMLEGDSLPLRYLVMKGAEVRVIPSHLIKNPHNASVLRTVKAHQRNVFTEVHRLKNDDGRKAIDKGWLAFDRHGYTVFVKMADVQVFF